MSRYLTRVSVSARASAGRTTFALTSLGVPAATIPEAAPYDLPFGSQPSSAGLTIARMLPRKASGQARY